jgi:hypothetical protein
MTMAISDGAARNRWRLILGKQAEGEMSLEDPRLGRMDDALDFLYSREAGADVRQAGLGASSPTVAHWLSEVRTLFPQETAEILQRHALDRYQLTELLADREVLEKLEPNQALLETVLSLKHLMKGQVLDTARRIVDKVVKKITEQMEQQVRSSSLGKLDRISDAIVQFDSYTGLPSSVGGVYFYYEYNYGSSRHEARKIADSTFYYQAGGKLEKICYYGRLPGSPKDPWVTEYTNDNTVYIYYDYSGKINKIGSASVY